MEESPFTTYPQPLRNPTETTWEALLGPGPPCLPKVADLLQASQRMARECPASFPACFWKCGNSEQDSCTLLSLRQEGTAIKPIPKVKKLSPSAYFCLGKLICPLPVSCVSFPLLSLPRQEGAWMEGSRPQGQVMASVAPTLPRAWPKKPKSTLLVFAIYCGTKHQLSIILNWRQTWWLKHQANTMLVDLFK